MSVLVESFRTKGSCPNARELQPLLTKAITKYGVENVRVYISTEYIQGYESQYLKLCCYKKKS